MSEQGVAAPGQPLRMLLPALHPGTVLAGRYRLTTPLAPADDDPEDAQRWDAVDDVLARPVRLLVLRAAGRRSAVARDALEAAAVAGSTRSGVLAAVYDAAVEEVPAERYGRPAGTIDVAYVVTERLDGAPLVEVLSDGPLDPDEAAARALAAADGLAAAHAAGVVHGTVDPTTLVLRPDGGVVLDDPVFRAALARRTRLEGAAPPRPQDDVRALAACLYAMLTARWPEHAVGTPAQGLSPAPVREGRVCAPRQVRAGIPRALDAVVTRALDSQQTPELTAEQFATALRDAVAADAAARAPVSRPPRRPLVPPHLRRRLPVLVTAAAFLLVGIGGFLHGRSLGTVQNETSRLERLVQSTPSPVPGTGDAGDRLDLSAPGITVIPFDPPPGDGPENTAAVPNAVDGDPSTAWVTERYDSSGFGGLKEGVGLLVDFGEPTAVSMVEVGLEPGTDVELRATDAPGADQTSFPVVARVEDADEVARLVPDQPVTARYFLLWLTELPRADTGDGFAGSISEVFFVRP